MTVDLSDLVNSGDVASMAGVGSPAVTNWHVRRESTGFPLPVAERWGMRLYLRTEVLEWLRATGRVR